MDKGRNVWLDTLRGAAAFGVVIFHLNAHTHHAGNLFNELTRYGASGVQVFFVLSGYCIQTAASRTSSAADFFWQRFWRIFPPYYFSLIVLLAVAVFRKILVGANDVAAFPSSLSAWAATLSIMTSPASSVPVMNWVYWTLSYEVAFYFVLGILVALPRAKFPVLCLLTCLSFFRSLHAWPGMFFLNQWPVFCLGVAYCEWRQGGCFHGAALMVLSAVSALRAFNLIESAIIAATTVTLIASVRWPRGILNRSNWLAAAGVFSYSIYLLHVPLGVFLFTGLQQRLGMDFFPVNLLYFAVIGCFCLLCAWLAFKFVEQPSMRVGKSFARAKSWALA